MRDYMFKFTVVEMVEDCIVAETREEAEKMLRGKYLLDEIHIIEVEESEEG